MSINNHDGLIDGMDQAKDRDIARLLARDEARQIADGSPRRFDDFAAAADYARCLSKSETVLIAGDRCELWPSGEVRSLEI